MRTTGFVLRLAALTTALVVGPATLAPGTAEAPSNSTRALASDSRTAAQNYHWAVMQWDFAWEFGESFDSGPYRGANLRGGRWVDRSDGTGRAVKYGGGVEFHSGRYQKGDADPDFGSTTLALEGKEAQRGRWELRERSQELETAYGTYEFLVELIPAAAADYDCGAHNLTIAKVMPGSPNVTIGANADGVAWKRTFTGYQRGTTEGRLYGVQITSRRITWFINGKAVASLGVAAAIPTVPMTMRLSLVGAGAREMNSTVVKIDWVRNYDLTRGDAPPQGYALTKGTGPAAC